MMGIGAVFEKGSDVEKLSGSESCRGLDVACVDV